MPLPKTQVLRCMLFCFVSSNTSVITASSAVAAAAVAAADDDDVAADDAAVAASAADGVAAAAAACSPAVLHAGAKCSLCYLQVAMPSACPLKNISSPLTGSCEVSCTISGKY